MSKKYQSLDVERWREYQEQGLNANSLWIIDKNIKDDLHQNDLHGQFVAQIPRELIFRYSEPGDIVADPFMGRGTTGIEARRQGRHFMGVELDYQRFEDAAVRIQQANDDEEIEASLVNMDCLEVEWPDDTLALSFVHPPYLNIIKFSDKPEDWSNKSYQEFMMSMDSLAKALHKATKINGHMVLVIGDIWGAKGIIPLSSDCMGACCDAGWHLRSTVIKNMSENTKGKGSGKDTNLKYYRALKGKTHVFSHEYIYIFRKWS